MTGSVELSRVLSDAEIHAALEREREDMRRTANYLEALCVRLARDANGGPPLSIVAESPRTNVAQTA
jgi:hypothetical protein